MLIKANLEHNFKFRFAITLLFLESFYNLSQRRKNSLLFESIPTATTKTGSNDLVANKILGKLYIQWNAIQVLLVLVI